MKNGLIDKRECGLLLGGISEKQVLNFVKTKGLPCKMLTRKTFMFFRDEVIEWAVKTPSILPKTERQQKDALRRKEEAEKRKQKKA